jgi:predicted transcriptional regulator
MIDSQLKKTIETLYQRQIGIRAISRQLGLSRNTVRKALSGDHKQANTTSRNLDHLSLIRILYARCKGNVVRIKQILADEHGIDMAYSSLTMMVRNHLREPQKKQSGTYVDAARYEFIPHEIGRQRYSHAMRRIDHRLQPYGIYTVLSSYVDLNIT